MRHRVAIVSPLAGQFVRSPCSARSSGRGAPRGTDLAHRSSSEETLERTRVTIRNGARIEFIDGARHGTPDPSSAATPASRGTASIRATGAHSFEIPREELDRNLANTAQLLTDVRALPLMKDGRVTGFRLLSIPPGSLFSQLGLRNGDAVTRINGFELNSIERSLELYSQLRSANHLELELERNRTVVRNTYSIR
jgi:general secretion pathway protein C